MAKRRGVSYKKRVEEINRIYDLHVKSGLPNREIWRRYIYPVYGISERTLYNLLNASAETRNKLPEDSKQLLLFNFEEKEDDRPSEGSNSTDTSGHQG